MVIPQVPDRPPVLEAELGLAAGGTATLEGGVRIHVLAGSGPEGTSLLARLVPEDAVVDLPHAGAAARIGPTLALTLPTGMHRPALIELPFLPGKLPGGLMAHSVHAARSEAGAWIELPGFLVDRGEEGARLVASAVRSGSVALLADPAHTTPRAAALPLSMLALLPAALGPAGGLPGRIEEHAGEEVEPLYVLETVRGTVVVQGRPFEILETKDRNKDGTPRLLAVRRKAGTFEEEPRAIAAALLASSVREGLARADLASLARLLEEDALFLDQQLGAPVATPLEEAVGRASAEDWQQRLGNEDARRDIEDTLVALELQRTRVACGALASTIATLDASTDDGDMLLALHASLSWLLGRLDVIHLLASPEPAGDAMAPPWHGRAEILGALEPGKKIKTKPLPEPVDPTGDGEPGVDLEALAKALEPLEAGAPSLAGLLAASRDLLPSVARLTAGAPGTGDWLDTARILATAAEVAARPARMAPPPDTGIRNYTFSSGVLTVVPEGTDEDGRVAAYRWWYDDGQDQHVVKGKGAFKAKLAGLRSGSHDIFVAAIDDDGQRDPTAARLSFYMRRAVDLKTQNVEVAFDAEPWNLNSEHARSVRTFVRELEGPVMECADDHYRFGIDGAGRVTMSFEFSADKTVNVAHSATIVKDTFKNKPLASCIRKSVKKPRMRYNQDYRPAATVTLTFSVKPFILFFDAATLGDVPGPDVVGAALYVRCTDKALRRVEAWCDAAVRNLPGPWDAQKWLGGEQEEEEETEETEEPLEELPDEPLEGIEEEPGDEAESEETEPAEEVEIVVIPPPEYDAIDIHARCVEKNLDIILTTCRVHLTKKRLWCVDSCMQKAKKCSKQCKNAADWSEDPYTCREACWTEEAFPCSEHCAVKKTPLAKEEPAASW